MTWDVKSVTKPRSKREMSTEGGIMMNFINTLRKLQTLLEKEELSTWENSCSSSSSSSSSSVSGFITLLTSQVISVAFYRGCEKSDKFCSEALISDWDSFTCLKSTTRDPRLYFLSEGSNTQDFYAPKNPPTSAGFEPANLGSSGEFDNQRTTVVDSNHWAIQSMYRSMTEFSSYSYSFWSLNRQSVQYSDLIEAMHSQTVG